MYFIFINILISLKLYIIDYKNQFKFKNFLKKCNNKTLIKYLVDHGANVNIKSDNGNTVLFNVCEHGNKTLVKFLVEHSADVNRKISTQIETPLIIAM